MPTNYLPFLTTIMCHGITTAEHAIKPFAKLRHVFGGVSTPKAIHDYLVLLSVAETCKYRGISFLDFLRSGELDIDKFSAGGRSRLKV